MKHDAKVVVVHDNNNNNQSWWEKTKNHLPTLSRGLAIFILVLNIIVPGLGTACLSCIGGSCKTEHLIIAVLQFVLAWIVIGWIWSILWGLLLLMKASKAQ